MNDTRHHHPTREQLAAFAHGTLDAADVRAVETHVGDCDTCCDVLREIPHDQLVERLRAAGSKSDGAETELPGEKSPVGPASVTPPASAIPPTLIDHPRYEVVKQLGVGGMGVVYQARHRLMSRTVALKVMSGKLLKNAAAIERFRQEVKAAARLSHRNIVTAYDAEQAGDVHFLIMEFVPGTDLATIVKGRGRLPVLHACNYVMQAAQGLQHAHEQGMVHRDIKPQNLMVTPKGAVKILDFGLARLATQNDDQVDARGLTREGATLGTPDYMSPEQARDSRRADIRSDIYSLGCTLYYSLTGVVPFPLGTAMEKVIAHCERTPTPLADLRNDIPSEIVHIVERMMAKDPAHRMQTPKEVVEALRPFALLKPANDPPLAIEATRADVSSPPDEPMKLESPQPADTIQVDESSVESRPLHQLSPQRSGLSGMSRFRPAVMLAAGALIAMFAYIAMQFLGNTAAPTVDNTENWIELIPQVDPSQHAVAGSWKRNGNELSVEAAESARLTLPLPPGPEYDFEVEFTRRNGHHSIGLMFVMGTGQATFEADAWSLPIAGFQKISGSDIRENGTKAEIQRLENGRAYKLLVQVRRDHVLGYLDGKLLATYRGDGSNLTLLDLWKLPDSKRLGIGAYQSATTFHRIRVRAVAE